MSPLIETIRLEDGVFFNLAYHQERVDRSLDELFNSSDRFMLGSFLNAQQYLNRGLYKCRVVYTDKIHEVQFNEYVYTLPRRLKLVFDDHILYDYKFEDRGKLTELYNQRGDADEIIIIKNHNVTDSFNYNILFWDGKRWVTPDTPLLRGTMRQRLLDQSLITESRIAIEDIQSFTRVKLINAMVGFNGPEIDVSEIVF